MPLGILLLDLKLKSEASIGMDETFSLNVFSFLGMTALDIFLKNKLSAIILIVLKVVSVFNTIVFFGFRGVEHFTLNGEISYRVGFSALKCGYETSVQV